MGQMRNILTQLQKRNKILNTILLHNWTKNELHCMVSFALLTGWIISFPYEGPLMFSLLADCPELLSSLSMYNLLFLATGMLTPIFFTITLKKTRKVLFVLLILCFMLGTLSVVVPIEFVSSLFYALSYIAGISLTLNAHQIKNNIAKKHLIFIAPISMILACFILIVTHLLLMYTFFYIAFIILQMILGVAIICFVKAELTQKVTTNNDKGTIGFVLKKFWLLLIFIFLMTINSGIMFQIMYPYFAEFVGLNAALINVPYIFAVFFFSVIYRRNKFNILYIGLALWGFALLLFANSEISTVSFFIIITCALCASGILDYFWWSIFTTSFDYVKNPSTMFSLILSVNILGVFAGKVLSEVLIANSVSPNLISQFGLMNIFFAMTLIVPINKMLSSLLINNNFMEKKHWNRIDDVHQAVQEKLSSREQEVFTLLIAGASDKEIASKLDVTLHTIKSHNRKIYQKLDTKNRIELRKHFVCK